MGEHVAGSRRRHAEALQMGGQQAVSRHRASGRLPARERVALLFDEGSRYQTGVLAQPERRTENKVPGDGVVTGFGRMDGRTVGLTGIDATALAGTTAPVSMRKQGRVIEQAQRLGVQDHERDGRQVGAGDRVFLVLQSANRERTRSPTWRPNIAARAVTEDQL
jgi:acetyl-CoA carboxylase carboxyltransferase component